jgi:hypothetical protein
MNSSSAVREHEIKPGDKMTRFSTPAAVRVIFIESAIQHASDEKRFSI